MGYTAEDLGLEQTDDLGHVAGAAAQEGVQVGVGIAVVGAPAGAVEEVEVAGFAVGGAVAAGVEVLSGGGLDQVDRRRCRRPGSLDDLLEGLSLSGVAAEAE